MPITTDQRAEKAHKKAALGVAMTNVGKVYYTEPASPNTAKAAYTWLDDAKIPATAPSSPVIDREYDEDGNNASTSGKQELIQYKEVTMTPVAGSPSSYIIPNENYAIAFNELNGAYAPVFLNAANDAVIPFGSNGMEFDSNAGVLYFIDGNPSGVTSVKIRYWKYVGRTMATSIDALSGTTIATTSFTIYDGASNISVSGNVATITHNANSSNLYWKLTENNVEILPESIVETSNNVLTITLNPFPIQTDNVVLKIASF